MSKAIRVYENGGPNVLKLEDVDPGTPRRGEVLIEHKAIGLNFIDIYVRNGLYPADLPYTPGGEASGVVLEVGPGVDMFRPGDRVAYCGSGNGAYQQRRVIDANHLVRVPDDVSLEQAAAVALKGMTVWMLLRRVFPIKKGHVLLYHAAAGGVGLMLGQWARHLGAVTIGTASSPEKLELARAHGFDHVIDYTQENFTDRVRAITGGKMCDVVYDSVGKDTFPASLDCLRPLGMFVSFGQSSGVVPPFSINLLQQKGSLFATRPRLFQYLAAREDLETAAAELFDVIGKGIVKPVIHQQYPLAKAGKAQEDLQARRTTGASILIP